MIGSLFRRLLGRRHCPHDRAQTQLGWDDAGQAVARTACPDCDFIYDGSLHGHPWSDEEIARRGVVDLVREE